MIDKNNVDYNLIKEKAFKVYNTFEKLGRGDKFMTQIDVYVDYDKNIITVQEEVFGTIKCRKGDLLNIDEWINIKDINFIGESNSEIENEKDSGFGSLPKYQSKIKGFSA